MNPIRNILVIVDPTARSQPAVAKGAFLAERFAARLDLFVCDTQVSWNARFALHLKETPRAPFEMRPTAWLDSIAEPLRRQGIDVTTEVSTADPLHTALLDRVRHTRADLVIKDTHHHTLAQRTFLTNTDWELIRGCPVSLLLVKPTPWSAVHRIGAAVDPGHVDDKPRLLDHCILDEAAMFAQRLNGELHVIHTYIPAAMIAAAVAVPPLVLDTPAEAVEAERKQRLQELATLTSEHPTPPANIHLENGGVSEVLCRLAHQCEIDIMTLGAISRRGLKRVLIGSTAESVLERLPCDMLVVKAPGLAEQVS